MGKKKRKKGKYYQEGKKGGRSGSRFLFNYNLDERDRGRRRRGGRRVVLFPDRLLFIFHSSSTCLRIKREGVVGGKKKRGKSSPRMLL